MAQRRGRFLSRGLRVAVDIDMVMLDGLNDQRLMDVIAFFLSSIW